MSARATRTLISCFALVACGESALPDGAVGDFESTTEEGETAAEEGEEGGQGDESGGGEQGSNSPTCAPANAVVMVECDGQPTLVTTSDDACPSWRLGDSSDVDLVTTIELAECDSSCIHQLVNTVSLSYCNMSMGYDR